MSRWLLRAALLWLVAGVSTEAVVALSPASLDSAQRIALLHAWLFGWVAQLIFGVAHWMFPKHSRERPRGDERLMVAAFALINLGLVARVAASAIPGSGLVPALVVAAAVLQPAACIAATVALWPRTRSR